MAKCFIHIGAPKTGSTAIQAFLKKEAERLRDAGIYFTDDRKFALNLVGAFHHAPADFFKRWRQVGGRGKLEAAEANVEDHLKKVIDQGHDFLISNEVLFGQATKIDFLSLRALIDKHFDQVKVLLFVRHPLDHFHSCVSENVKKNLVSIQDYSQMKSLIFNWEESLNSLRDGFRTDEIMLADYNKLKSGDNILGALNDFLSSTGVELDGRSLGVSNRRFSYDALTIMDELHQAQSKQRSNSEIAVNRQFLRNMQPNKSLLGPRVAKKLVDQHANDISTQIDFLNAQGFEYEAINAANLDNLNLEKDSTLKGLTGNENKVAEHFFISNLAKNFTEKSDDVSLQHKNAEFDFTVVIPSHNSELFILKALESAALQVGVSKEIIVINDLGEDDTAQVVEKYAGSPLPVDTVIRLYNRSGRNGQATARNLGIAKARGKYISFLDSDDIYNSSFALFDALQEIEKFDAELLVCQFNVRLGSKAIRRGRKIAKPANNGRATIAEWPQLVNVTSCWQIVYKRSLFQSEYLRFNKKLKQREDRPFFVRAICSSDKIAISDICLIEKLARDDSSFTRKDKEQFSQYLIHLSDLNDTYENCLQSSNTDEDKHFDFLVANHLLTLKNIREYWRRLIVDLLDDDPKLVFEFFDILRKSGQILKDADPQLFLGNGWDFYDGLKLKRAKEIEISFFHTLLLATHDNEILKSFWTESPLDFLSKLLASSIEIENVSLFQWLNSSSFRIGGSVRNSNRKVSDPPQILLHGGMPKTGSSSFQNCMQLNWLKLLREGVLFPPVGFAIEQGSRRFRTAGHIPLLLRLAKKQKNSPDINQNELYRFCSVITQMLQSSGYSGITKIILSAENILSPEYYKRPIWLNEVKQSLEFGNITFVGFYREPTNFLQSYCLERLSNHRNTFGRGTISRHILDVHASGLLEKNKVLDRLDKIFGPDNSILFEYEKAKSGGNVPATILKVLNIDISTLAEVPKFLENHSKNIFVASVIWQLKKMRVPPLVVETILEDIYKEASQNRLGTPKTILNEQGLDVFVKHLNNFGANSEVTFVDWDRVLINKGVDYEISADLKAALAPALLAHNKQNTLEKPMSLSKTLREIVKLIPFSRPIFHGLRKILGVT